MSHLKDQVILVTGGTSGIGQACTELFTEHGAKVIAMSIQAEQGQALANRLQAEGRTCLFHSGDVRREEDVRAAVELALSRFGRLDAACANAGVLRTQKITQVTLEDFNLVMGVNLLGAIWVAKYAIPVMERQGKGCICFTTSVASEIGFPEHGVYCASKAGLVALMRCLVTDHSPKGVRFVAVSPGTIDTPMLASSCEGWDKPKEELYADVARKIPVRRLGQPMDVAKVIGFLLSDEAGYVNGSVVYVEGGTLALPPW